MKEASKQAALQSFRIEAEAVAAVPGYMDFEAFGRAVDALAAADKVVTCASGSSGIAAKKFAHSLNCIERPAQFMVPSEAVHGGLGTVRLGNVVVMVSRGGKTAELLPILRVCLERGATVIGVTENMDAPLAQSAHIVLPMKIERESDPCNVMATASYMMTVGLFDALLAAVMTETGYRIEQFAQIHPGGAVGERLNK